MKKLNFIMILFVMLFLTSCKVPTSVKFENYVDNANLDNCWTLSYKFTDKPVYVTSNVNMAYNAYAMEGSKYLTLGNGNNIANVSRQFYLEKGTYYCISAWATMSKTGGERTTLQLKNLQ